MVLFWFDPTVYRFYPLCLFHSATGLWCPGCGSLRALHQLLCGHVASAFHFNPLLVVSLPWLLAYWTVRIHRGYRGLAPPKLRPAWILLFLSGALAFGILRNLPGPFAVLRP